MDEEKYQDKFRIGIVSIEDLKDLFVEVITEDDPNCAPCMHIHNESFHTDIGLYDNSMCGKNRFSVEQLKSFIEWLDKPTDVITRNKISNWKTASILWKIANPDSPFSEENFSLPMTRPEYVIT